MTTVLVRYGSTGIFTTRDPLDGIDGTPDVANPYTYVHNSPLNSTDPLGLQATDPDFAASFPAGIPFPDVDIGGCIPFVGCGNVSIPTPGTQQVIDRAVNTAALEQFSKSLEGRTQSPTADAIGYRNAQYIVTVLGNKFRQCATTSTGRPVGCVYPVPRHALPAFIINPDAEAFTMGHYVFCEYEAGCGRPDDVNYPNWLVHELVHVIQFEVLGDNMLWLYPLEAARSLNKVCDNGFEEPAYKIAPVYSSGRRIC